MDTMERFRSFTRTDGDHWMWIGGKTGSKSTYGVFYAVGHQQVYAHRWVYEQCVGPIPEGYQIDHLCRVPLCVNPEHLEAVTPEENARRTRLAVCRAGLHDLTDPANMWFYRGKRRGCLPCRRASSRKFSKAKKAR